jgi:Rrf2 family protein
MKINTNIRYGLRAIIEIAINDKPVLQKEIAERQEISVNYLDSIIAGLKNTGLIKNFRGKSSGYILAKPIKQISIYDIYRGFEPELELVNCNCLTNECKRSNICPSKDYCFDLNSQIKQIMKISTLDKLAKNSEEYILN